MDIKKPDKVKFRRLLSDDSHKAIMSRSFNYLNAINYMAPHNSSGFGGTLCSNASPGCVGLCLGWFSGQAAMIKKELIETGVNKVRQSRINKALYFVSDNQAYLEEVAYHVHKAKIKADKLGFKLCIRLNGSTDIPYENLKIKKYNNKTIYELFSEIQFVDYTKIFSRLTNKHKPKNLHLTFSRSEINEPECIKALNLGFNVAIVFAERLPKFYKFKDDSIANIKKVYSGVDHDLRFLDPHSDQGNIIGLLPKGLKAKNDSSGFVVRSHPINLHLTN